MRNEKRKYNTDHSGEFVTLNDRELNELNNYNMDLFPKPCMLYVKPGYRFTGKEETLTHHQLQDFLGQAINLSIN
jgi:hypothetical protein